jgi:hypothetical protein
MMSMDDEKLEIIDKVEFEDSEFPDEVNNKTTDRMAYTKEGKNE